MLPTVLLHIGKETFDGISAATHRVDPPCVLVMSPVAYTDCCETRASPSRPRRAQAVSGHATASLIGNYEAGKANGKQRQHAGAVRQAQRARLGPQAAKQ